MNLSILIPVYGVAKYIEQFAVSMFEMYDNDEVEYIFVDDCSPDKSMEKLKSVLQRYPNEQPKVRIITHEHNRGLAAARLTGLKYAKGDYVWFVDSDDWLEANALRTLHKAMKKYSSPDVLWFSAYWHGKREGEQRSRVSADTLLCALTWPTLWCCIVRRQFLLDNDILPIEGLNYGEDRIMTSRIACMAQSSAQISNRLYHYRTDNDNSLSNMVSNRLLLQDAMGGVKVVSYYADHKMVSQHIPSLYYNQAIRHHTIRNIQDKEAKEVRRCLLQNMWRLNSLMTSVYFMIGWLLPVKKRVSLLYYYSIWHYGKGNVPYVNEIESKR